MAVAPKVQIKRTETPNNAPANLLPGELAVEMAAPTRLWVGVPTSIDPTGRKMLLDTETAGGALVADAPPPNLTQGDFWWESDTGILWMWYIDANTSQFVQVNGIPVGVYLKLSGGTMTGDLVIDKSSPTIELRKMASGENATVASFMGGARRWSMHLGDNVPESGAGVGSDFTLQRFNDAGTLIGNGLHVKRSTGDLTITGEAFKPVAGPWVASSDERIKNVHGDYLTGLKDIKRLQPVRYSFKGNDSVLSAEGDDHGAVAGKEFIGLVAQQAETSMPELVKSVTGWIDNKQVDDYRILDPNALTYALINAVKQLSAEVDALRAQVDELKERHNGN